MSSSIDLLLNAATKRPFDGACRLVHFHNLVGLAELSQLTDVLGRRRVIFDGEVVHLRRQ